METGADDLRQFDERSLSQGCAEEFHRSRIRNDGGCRLACLSSAYEAQLANERLFAGTLRKRTGSSSYLVRSLRRRRTRSGADKSSTGRASICSIPVG